MRNVSQLVLAVLFGVSAVVAQPRVKITVADNAVLAPVQVNGRQFSFLLDTGSERSAIAPEAAKTLGLPLVGKEELLRDYRTQDSTVVRAQRLALGTVEFRKTNLSVVDLSQLSRALGQAVDGVLGNDFLTRFVFTLNYSQRTLNTHPRNVRSWGTPVHLRRDGADFYLPLTIVSTPVELLLDSGTNSTNLSWTTWQKLAQVWKPDSIIEGVVRAGAPAPSAFMVCLPTLSIGTMEVADQAVRVQKEVQAGAFASSQFGGILGSDVLRNFEITFDLSNDRVYLARDHRYTTDPYRFVTIGIQFVQSPGGFTVMSVWRDSPADRAGIRPGDIITSIDGDAATLLSPDQVTVRFHGAEGMPVNLVIERNGNPRRYSLFTRRLLCGNQQSRSLQAVTR